jgi:hypothetical protein
MRKVPSSTIIDAPVSGESRVFDKKISLSLMGWSLEEREI